MHRSRVCEIHLLDLKTPQWQQLFSGMLEQFPALTHLRLGRSQFSLAPPTPALPDGFLGESAPRLQSLELRCVPFPALPKLLLSANDLVHLTLEDIPDSAYISSKEIVTCLAVLANLKSLAINPDHTLYLPDGESRRSPPTTCAALPTLTHFHFAGYIEYLEDLVSGIDAPLLDSIDISLARAVSDFPQLELTRFIRRSTKFQPPNEIHVHLRRYCIQVKSLPQKLGFDEAFRLKNSFETDWVPSTLERVFVLLFPSVDMVDHLYIYSFQYSRRGYSGMWDMGFFHPFTAVKNLYVSKGLARCIALSLKELVEERVADVLPALESIFLEELQPSGPVQEAIGQFVAARQLLGRPVVAVSPWDRTGDHFVFQPIQQSGIRSSGGPPPRRLLARLPA
jgi:hypothetical protein